MYELENQVEELIDETYENEVLGYEEELGQISVVEEIKRIEIFENYEMSDELKSLVSNEAKRETADLVYMFHELSKAGIDYNNALAISSNYSTNKANRELAKIQGIQTQQNSI